MGFLKESGDWILFPVLAQTNYVALEKSLKTSLDLSFLISKIKGLWKLVSVL